jgi:hypothetical protein
LFLWILLIKSASGFGRLALRARGLLDGAARRSIFAVNKTLLRPLSRAMNYNTRSGCNRCYSLLNSLLCQKAGLAMSRRAAGGCIRGLGNAVRPKGAQEHFEIGERPQHALIVAALVEMFVQQSL